MLKSSRFTALQLFSCYRHAACSAAVLHSPWFTFYNDWLGPDSCQHQIMDGSPQPRAGIMSSDKVSVISELKSMVKLELMTS